MAMDDSSVRCPLCRARFDSSVALAFHGRREHPGATGAVDLASRDLAARERRERAVKHEARARKQVADFCRAYHAGQPCYSRFVVASPTEAK